MNLTIASITLRALLGRRRVLLLLPLPLLLIGLTFLAHGLAPDNAHKWGPPVVDGLGFGVLLPIIALIVGTGVLGAEIEDGTIVHILAKPLPRREIILAKLAVAAGVTAVASAVPMAIAGAIAESGRFALALAVASTVGALAYSAVFLLLSVLTRRPVLIGLLYVLLWEGLLSRVLGGTAVLSIHQYSLTIAEHIAPTDVLRHQVGLPVSVVLSAVVVVAGTVLAIDRLRSFTLTGETG